MVLTNCEWRLKELVREEQEKRRLAEEQAAFNLTERNRMARELHDARAAMTCPECKAKQEKSQAWIAQMHKEVA